MPDPFDSPAGQAKMIFYSTLDRIALIALCEQQAGTIEVIVAELSQIYNESILPDGDHVDVSTALWAGDAMNRIFGVTTQKD